MRERVADRPAVWILWNAALVLVLGLAAACGSEDDGSSGDGEVTIVTTTSIIGALAGEVAGEHGSVTELMGPGVDPHSFEITPGSARDVSVADVVLVNGLGLDDFLLDDIDELAGDAPIIVVTEGIELLEGGHEHDGEGHEEGEHDPHVWQDPLRVKAMVANIAAALAGVDPDNAAVYKANAEAYQVTLDDTHAEIMALIDEIPEGNRKIVTNHGSFGYFAEHYGLEIVAAVIPGSSTEADPSAGDLAELTELIEREGVKAIFTERLLDPKVAEQLAAEAGVEIVEGLYTDQVGEEGSGAESVHAMLLENARKISEALR